MRRSAVLFFTGLMISLSACHKSGQESHGIALNSAAPAASQNSPSITKSFPKQLGDIVSTEPLKVEGAKQQALLDSPGAAQAVERKVIQNAEMTIETDSPDEGRRRIASIADKHNGFVVISESKQNEAVSQNVASTVVNVVVRVPARRFEAAIAEIRGVGGRILHEKSLGQDVTEEYIDLEARIRTKRALETQFLEIMRQARKISEALEVQTQLAAVRTEIEQLEGRRRFLENQSALSTIQITLHTPTPVVAAATRGFLYDLKAAFGDGMEIGKEIFLGAIRFLIVMIPVTLFILTPAWFVFKWLRKRFPWPSKEAAVSVANPADQLAESK